MKEGGDDEKPSFQWETEEDFKFNKNNKVDSKEFEPTP